MPALGETVNETGVSFPVKEKAKESILSRFLSLLCSVRFGVVMLILLGLACLIGMLIMQQSVEGFSNYYAQITPSQRLVYGKLGFFDIYHSWYFNTLLFVLSVNIILASIDRIPKTWAVVSKPNLTVPLRWLKSLKQTETISLEGNSREEVAERLAQAFKKAGWRKPVVSEKGGRTFVFAQSGAWNRLGAYAVHVGLLTIFIGGFLTTQLGQNGQMPLMPGQTSNEIFESDFELDEVKQFNKRLPFEITCTDIQQKLIKKDGSISTSNTIDWLTRIRIKDGAETHDALVQMNRPFDYRGYRFFQASFVSTGRARNITLSVTPAGGGEPQGVTIPRDGTSALADGTKITLTNFRGNFSLSKEDPNEDTSNYPNPGAVLRVTPPNGASQTAYAFGPQMANIPAAKNPVAGYTYQLTDFEKVSDQHILAVQYDPGANVVYVGFGLLFLTLVSVFFFSHQRVWAAIEETSENRFQVVIAGDTNRSQNAFDEKFRRFMKTLREQNQEAQNL
jgi:cytochrome c biogenesis protein